MSWKKGTAISYWYISTNFSYKFLRKNSSKVQVHITNEKLSWFSCEGLHSFQNEHMELKKEKKNDDKPLIVQQ